MPKININMSKGITIDLSKVANHKVEKFCIGANWGMMEVKTLEMQKTGGFLGFGGKMEEVETVKKEAVDLDLSLVSFNKDNKVLSTVYFGNKSESGIKHSGDDLTGDADGDDGEDNETIEVDLTRVDSKCTTIFAFLNSFNNGQDFHSTPYSGIRIYEGKTKKNPSEVLAQFEVHAKQEYAGKRSMVLGRFDKKGDSWEFTAIGDVSNDTKISETVNTIKSKYL